MVAERKGEEKSNNSINERRANESPFSLCFYLGNVNCVSDKLLALTKPKILERPRTKRLKLYEFFKSWMERSMLFTVIV